jgi:hypothetical protein
MKITEILYGLTESDADMGPQPTGVVELPQNPPGITIRGHSQFAPSGTTYAVTAR